jgi:hypothetical protein
MRAATKDRLQLQGCAESLAGVEMRLQRNVHCEEHRTTAGTLDWVRHAHK